MEDDTTVVKVHEVDELKVAIFARHVNYLRETSPSTCEVHLTNGDTLHVRCSAVEFLRNVVVEA